MSFTAGSMSIDVLAPKRDEYDEDTSNNSSLVCLVTFGTNRLLFAGDIQEERIDEMIDAKYDLTCDLLKVPHHGAYEYNTDKLVEATKPTYAVICCSKKNPEDDDSETPEDDETPPPEDPESQSGNAPWFLIPLFLLALEWIGAMVTSMDPRRQNITPKMFTLVLWIAPVISIIGAAAIYPYNIGMKMNISLFGMLFTGLLFIVIGNYLPKARQNYTIGIRIPWTLANEQNWNKTHRMAGYLWIAGGVLLILLGLIGIFRLEWLLAIIVVMVVIPAAYSCWLHTAKGL